MPRESSALQYFLAHASVDGFREELQPLTASWEGSGWSWAQADAMLLRVIDLFENGSDTHEALDTPYHDTRHTLQVLLCWCRMVEAFRRTTPKSHLPGPLLQAGFYAALFHDSGYLKDRGDQRGTGAKLAAIHERRSCRIARDILAREGELAVDTTILNHLIVATGPRTQLPAIPFKSPQERLLAQMLATADFLAQLSDPNYPQKLPSLYQELREAETARHFSQSPAQLQSVDAFRAATPPFWKTFVLPHLDRHCAAAYRFLNNPYPDGPNAYLDQIERNLCLIRPSEAPTPPNGV